MKASRLLSSRLRPDLQPALLRLHASAEVKEFWPALQALLAAAVPHDALVTYLNFLDFRSSWRAARILTTDNAVRPAAWFEGRRQVDMTPRFVLSQPGRLKLYRLSDAVPDSRRLRRSAFFRDYLAPAGWRHLAVMLFWRGDRVCSQIALRRTAAQGDFTAAELRLLQDLHPHLATVLDRLLRQEEEKVRRGWLERFNDHLPFALLLLDFELAPVYVNREGLAQCAAWNRGPLAAAALDHRAVFQVPEAVRAGCAELRRRWLAGGAPAETRTFRCAHPQHRGLVATIALQADDAAHAAKPDFVVHFFRETETAGNFPVRSMLGRLTVAERALAAEILRGGSNREAAAALGKSVFTIKRQLTSIFRKLGVASRGQLLARCR